MTAGARRWRVSDFMTDGSLLSLIESLAALLDVDASLRDLDGRRIRATHATPPWTIDEPDRDTHDIAAQLAGDEPDPDPDRERRRLLVPILVGQHPCGAIAVRFREDDHQDPHHHAGVAEVVRRLAHTAEEFCNEYVSRKRGAEDLALLFRLSSALVARRSPDEGLELALHTALELTGADAGSIHLLDDESANLQLRASFGMSPPTVEALADLPAGRVIDAAVLQGEAVLVPDLEADGRALHLDRLLADGLTSMLSVGLLFRGRASGVLRLYARGGPPPDRRAGLLARSVAEQAAASIAGQRLGESERRRRQIHRALELASSVQRRMLPATPPDVERLDVAWRYESSFELGGDFIDLIELGDHLGVAIGDVVGKGAPAAMLMAAVRAFLRSNATIALDPDLVIERVNHALTRDTLDNEFATIFYGVIDPASLRLTYCNGGHDPPFVLRSRPGRDDEILPLDVGGMLVGIDAAQRYERAAFDLHPGDILVAFTDGVTDALNFDNQKFGRARLEQAISQRLADDAHASAEDLASHVLWSVRRYVGLRPLTDDFTLVVTRVTQ
jgi:sigma-B regulation protein RsbU (phosphoserine phosphatase)